MAARKADLLLSKGFPLLGTEGQRCTSGAPFAIGSNGSPMYAQGSRLRLSMTKEKENPIGATGGWVGNDVTYLTFILPNALVSLWASLSSPLPYVISKSALPTRKQEVMMQAAPCISTAMICYFGSMFLLFHADPQFTSLSSAITTPKCSANAPS